MSYNPGTPQGLTQTSPTTWAVDSFRGEGAYQVTITETGCSCSCPHYTKRLAGTDAQCKHIVQVIEATRFNRLIEKAQTATTEQLETLLPAYEAKGRLDIALAIRCELHARA